MTRLLLYLIPRVVPPLVGFVIWSIALVFLGVLFVLLADFTVPQAAVAEIAIVIFVFATEPRSSHH